MRTSDFYFDLPEELIAQDPLDVRSDSKLLVINKNNGELRHDIFRNITSYLKKGDCLVLNDTKVIPARLLGQKEDTKANIEVLLLKRITDTDWECLVKPGKKLRPGSSCVFGEGLLKAEILDILDDGKRFVRFSYDGIWEEILDKLGQMPLPPYITHKLKDKDRYQTVYAKYEGSAAAPTAGLHFTKELLEEIKDMGVSIAYVTLHVGLGTFRPVKADNILDHHMHSEYFHISEESAKIINEAKASGRIICVGTTSCRTIESAAGIFEKKALDEGREWDGRIAECEGDTEIFIYPGYRFKILDCLITNFHLPESTLLMLVSALAGRENVLNAYKVAVSNKYRFFSFGDACFFTDE
ncbi:MAG: tRNA preQ1(34) S-adenosylmethionine ribosyltransferase-isomerase QueA [Lachnospiraceae bacterium]|nr:tRNA preQ1(34) S-adenosylmethionine ribosyltransferase-isomerase QueA [Lachnospiraceae bacterium]